MRGTSIATRASRVFVACALVACGSSSSPAGTDRSTEGTGDAGPGPGPGGGDGAAPTSPSPDGGGPAPNGVSPTIAGCDVFPANHIFNTPIDGQALDARSAAYMTTIGSHRLHLDLGTTVDPTSDEYYGIPYNVVHGASVPWAKASFTSADKDLDWNPRPESDCAADASHAVVSPCTAAAAPNPIFPFPASMTLVEGGSVTDPAQPYGDHHVLLLDADSCRLWELFHVYPASGGAWDIFGAATFDLHSNALRTAGWTSADAAGFPILPLLLRADEASSGTIRHALRFTVSPGKIRGEYVWPARHLTSEDASATDHPPMGQLFRIKASYVIPANFGTQARAILQAMKTYGMYVADGGSDMYVQGEPSAAWQDDTFSQVQSVGSDVFEAVNLTPIARRAGFDPNSGAVPAP